MADAVTTQTLVSGSRRVVRVFTNVSDGVGESAVNKIDISAMEGAPTIVKINKVTWSCRGMAVRVLFDHTTDDTVLVLHGEGQFDFTAYGGLHDPASAGGTGDVLFTTINQVTNDSYTIMIDVSF